MTWQRVRAFLLSERALLGAYVLACVVVSLQQYLLPPKKFVPDGAWYTHYNNYVVFKTGFAHLMDGQNLFAAYPAEYWDLFKYSPSFALAMAPFAAVPDWLGLTVWNLLNGMGVFFALRFLPHLARESTAKMRWFVLPQLLTATQNAQSNSLIVALMVASYVAWEHRRIALATLAIVVGTFIKPFAIVAGLLWFFYPRKVRALATGLAWTVAIGLLPAVVIGWQSLKTQYENWMVLLQTDFSNSVGLSVRGWLQSWFGLSLSNTVVLAIGAVLLVTPLARLLVQREQAGERFREAFLASIVIWVVIFNHRAESPTFIIAATGVAIWYFSKTAPTRFEMGLVVLSFVLTSLAPHHILPASMRSELVGPFVIKAVGCIIIWIRLTVELLQKSEQTNPIGKVIAA